MTPAQHMAIEWACTRLINLYANLTDQHRWSDLVELYTDDGMMTRPSAPDIPIVGKPALLAGFLARPPRASRHFCTNIVVTADSETSARAESNILLFTGGADRPDEHPVLDDRRPLVGRYADRITLGDAGWRFSERRGMLVFR